MGCTGILGRHLVNPNRVTDGSTDGCTGIFGRHLVNPNRVTDGGTVECIGILKPLFINPDCVTVEESLDRNTCVDSMENC